MSIEQTNVVDFIGITKEADEVVLTISDHLDWDDSEKHLLMLQDKLNHYMTFIESGQLIEKYPNARGKAVVISIFHKHDYPEMGRKFIDKVRLALKPLNVELSISHLPT